MIPVKRFRLRHGFVHWWIVFREALPHCIFSSYHLRFGGALYWTSLSELDNFPGQTALEKTTVPHGSHRLFTITSHLRTSG